MHDSPARPLSTREGRVLENVDPPGGWPPEESQRAKSGVLVLNREMVIPDGSRRNLMHGDASPS